MKFNVNFDISKKEVLGIVKGLVKAYKVDNDYKTESSATDRAVTELKTIAMELKEERRNMEHRMTEMESVINKIYCTERKEK